ncbi:MAG TPA: ABC transporter substrate-binding protein, partial [Chloroflexota bacterium]|nr:ABC transporter substrate-binding protein [Chloroflexota bacterium]
MTRSFTWVSGSILVLLLSACGGASAPAAPVSNSAPPATSSSSAGTASAKPAPASGATTSAAVRPAASAASGGPIKLGVIVPLTGTTADSGLNQRDGINLYLDQAHNTMAGRPVEVTFADSQSKPDMALPKAKELVENQNAKALLGFVLTPECYAVAGYVKEAQVPMIVSNNCGAVHLTTDPKLASPYVFRTTFNNQGQIAPLADWAYNQGLRKTILTASDYGGGYEIADAFAWAFVHRGGQIVQELYPALGAPDFGPNLAQLSPNADSVFAFFPGADGLHWAQQYPDYAGNRKMQVMAGAGALARDGNLTQLGDKA